MTNINVLRDKMEILNNDYLLAAINYSLSVLHILNGVNKVDNNLPQGKIFYFDYECNNN